MLTRRAATLLGASALISACGNAATVRTGRTEVLSAANTDMPDTDTPDTNWANLTKSDWKDRLTASEFDVLRKEGTERPWSSPLNDEKRMGTYVCAGCALPLFKTETKFDSGTGWPSFYDPIPGAVETKKDYKMIVPRTEYHCSRCGGHQGHVFKDGPNPTGLRYCNNGVALDFVPADQT